MKVVIVHAGRTTISENQARLGVITLLERELITSEKKARFGIMTCSEPKLITPEIPARLATSKKQLGISIHTLYPANA